jgi:hypothetical protein
LHKTVAVNAQFIESAANEILVLLAGIKMYAEKKGWKFVASRPDVALETFACGQSHDLRVRQCEKCNNFLLQRSTDVNTWIYGHYPSVRASNRKKIF